MKRKQTSLGPGAAHIFWEKGAVSLQRCKKGDNVDQFVFKQSKPSGEVSEAAPQKRSPPWR